MGYNKKQALSIILDSAEQYENNLKNKNLLFVSLNKNKQLSFTEVEFNASNFMHLTGIKITDNFKRNSDNKTNLANLFYKKCLNKRLSLSDFDFANDGTTQLKLAVLPQLMCENLSANSIGYFDKYRPKLYTEKIAGNIKGCMGFVNDAKTNKIIPNTILNEDIRNISSDLSRIIVTYQKEKTDDKYTKIVYTAKNINWEEINFPEAFCDLPKPISK